MGPRVDLSGSASNFDKPVVVGFGGPPLVARPGQLRSATLAIRQPITGLWPLWEKAKLEGTQEEIAGLDLEIKKIDAAFSAAEAYLRLQEASEKQRIADASIVATESQARDAASLVESGRIIKSDLLKIEIAKQEAKAARARAVADRQKSMANLAFLLNLPENTQILIEPLPQSDTKIKSISAASQVIVKQAVDLSHVYNQALEHRLDLKQVSLMINKAHHAQHAADTHFAPMVDAVVSWDRYYDRPPFATPVYTRTIALQATWQLWDNGSRVYAHREAAANIQKAEAAVQLAKDKLRLQLESVIADLQAATEALTAAEATVAQAEEAYRLDKARFNTGLVTATDLVLSETAQTRARGALISALTQVEILNLMTQKALGDARPHAGLH